MKTVIPVLNSGTDEVFIFGPFRENERLDEVLIDPGETTSPGTALDVRVAWVENDRVVFADVANGETLFKSPGGLGGMLDAQAGGTRYLFNEFATRGARYLAVSLDLSNGSAFVGHISIGVATVKRG